MNKTGNKKTKEARAKHSSEGLSREEYVERVKRRKNNEIDDNINTAKGLNSNSRRNLRSGGEQREV